MPTRVFSWRTSTNVLVLLAYLITGSVVVLINLGRDKFPILGDLEPG